MKLRIELNYQFYLLFFVGAILPLVMLSSMFWSTLNTRVKAEYLQSEQSGLLFVQDILQHDSETLYQSARQSAMFSLGMAFEDSFGLTNQAKFISIAQRQYQNSQYNYLELYDSQGKPVFSITDDTMVKANMPKPSDPLKLMKHNTAHYGIEACRPPHTCLYYTAFVPIPSQHEPGKMIGLLNVGRLVDQSFSLRKHVQIIQGLNIQLTAASPTHKQRVIYQSSGPTQLTGDQQLGKQNPDTGLTSPILNPEGKLVGTIRVHQDSSLLNALKTDNIKFMLLYVFLALVVVIGGGIWFKESLITPLQQLALVTKEVYKGNLTARFWLRQTSPLESELSDLVLQFNTLVERLEEEERVRNTFISTLSHDLKTPLVAQQRILELIEQHPDLSQEMSFALSQLKLGNTELFEMVNQILSSYQYEAGLVNISLSKINLQQLVQECLNTFQNQAEKKSILLLNNVPESLPEIEADRSLLKRLFNNLIDNALTNIGKEKQVRIEATSAENGIQIKVCDNGPGIAKDRLPHIFKRYYTGEQRRKKIGTGLGLFICKMIVEQHQGSIQAESELNKGCTFIIDLPVQQAEEVHV